MALKLWSAGEKVTADDLNNNFDETFAEVDMAIPIYQGLDIDDVGIMSTTSTTTAEFMRFNLPAKITVNKISIYNNSGAWTLKVGIYKADGQTKLLDIDIAVTATGVNTKTLASALELPPGDYYIVAVPVSGSPSVYGYKRGTFSQMLSGVSSEPIVLGTKTVTASTLPITFDPTSLTSLGLGSGGGVMFRLDN